MLLYKIVKRQDDGTLTSTYARGRARVTYRPGERVRPRIGGSLFLAFETLADVERFGVQIYCGEELWLADGGRGLSLPVKRVLVLDEIGRYDNGVEVRRFWAAVNRYDPFKSHGLGGWTNDAPQGTVGCRSVKLLKRLVWSDGDGKHYAPGFAWRGVGGDIEL